MTSGLGVLTALPLGQCVPCGCEDGASEKVREVFRVCSGRHIGQKHLLCIDEGLQSFYDVP